MYLSRKRHPQTPRELRKSGRKVNRLRFLSAETGLPVRLWVGRVLADAEETSVDRSREERLKEEETKKLGQMGNISP